MVAKECHILTERNNLRHARRSTLWTSTRSGGQVGRPAQAVGQTAGRVGRLAAQEDRLECGLGDVIFGEPFPGRLASNRREWNRPGAGLVT